MRMFYLFALLVCLATVSYGGSPKSPSVNVRASGPGKARVDVNTKYLCQHWVNSREEERQTDKDQVYRPKDFKAFPPSRFRMEYIFHKNGDCEWYFLAPDDGHYFKSGKWRIDPHDKSVLQIIKGDTTESYRITTLTKNLLRMTVAVQPKWTAFVESARRGECSGTRNRLFVIDDQLVFHDSAGNCADAGYAEILYGKSVDDVLCSYTDSIAGPRKSCTNPKYAGLFETIITHLNKADLGLGPRHTVRRLPL